MKSILPIALFFLFSCGTKEVDKPTIIKSWEVNVNTGDTINRMDSNDKKQGLWIENKTYTVIYKDGIKVN